MTSEMKTDYEVWMTQGQGEVKVAEFKTLREACDYCRPRAGVDGSYAIKRPDGTSFEWDETGW